MVVLGRRIKFEIPSRAIGEVSNVDSALTDVCLWLNKVNIRIERDSYDDLSGS